MAQRVLTAADSAQWEKIKQEKMARWNGTPQAGNPLIVPLSGTWPGNNDGIHVNRATTNTAPPTAKAFRDYTPEELVISVFLRDEGLDECIIGGFVSNVQFRGLSWNHGTSAWDAGSYDRSLSYFDNGLTNLGGVEEGLLLSTGGGLLVEGPNTTTSGLAGGTFTADANLQALVTQGLITTSILEFDFIPLIPEISFDYIFASEEYSEYANSAYNDVFGFFISGPGITGTRNIATLPTTNTTSNVVSINNVNNGNTGTNSAAGFPGTNPQNPEYFVPNYNNPQGQYMEYDGRTTLLTARCAVQIGQTYHLKLAVANAGDDLYGSGVFLRAGSFDLGVGVVNYGINIMGMDNVFEGCANNSFAVSLSPNTVPRNIGISYTGPGAPYLTKLDGTALDATLAYPAHSMHETVQYKVADNIPSNNMYVDITAYVPNCNVSFTKRIFLFKSFSNPVLTTTPACSGSTGAIQVSVTGGTGYPQLSIDGGTTWQNKITGLAPGTYNNIRVRDSIGCQIITGLSATITSKPTVSGGISNQTYCNGIAVTPPAFTSSATGATYTWSNNNTGIGLAASGSGNLPTFTPTNATSGNISATITVRATAGGCTGDPQTFTITVTPALNAGTISSTQSICYNTAPTLTQTAASGGTGLSYQWEQSTNGGSNWANVSGGSGGTSALYTPPALTQTTMYRRKVTSGGSCGTATTNNITITVYGNLDAGTIGSTQSICYNTAPTLTQTAASGGTGLSYQWEFSTDGGTNWANVTVGSGGTSALYTPPVLTQTTMYRRKVTSGGGCGTATTSPITVTVHGDLNPGTINASQSICYNTAPTAFTQTPASGGTGLSYQWEQSTDGGSNWANVSGGTGGTTALYTPPVLTQTTMYRRKVNSGGSCGTATTSPITITVYGNLNAGTIGSSHSICYNTAPTAFTQTPASGGTGLSYQWEQSTDGGGTWANVSGGTGGTTALYTPPVLTQTTMYRRKVTSGGGCGTATTSPITVTVHGDLNPGTITNGSMFDYEIICYDSVPTMDLEQNIPPSGGTGLSYQWQKRVEGSSTWVNIDGATNPLSYHPPALTDTTYYRLKVSSSAGCGEVYTNVLAVRVRGKIISGTIAANQTICYGAIPSSLSITPASGGTELFYYHWYSKTETQSSWTDLYHVGSTYQPNHLTETTMYRVRVTDGVGGCGEVISDTVTISVLPASMLKYRDLRISICPGTASINLSKFIDTLGVTSVQWNPVGMSPSISSSGIINTGTLNCGSTYTYTYTISNSCISDNKQKVYLHVIRDDKFSLKADTVVVCYKNAATLQINQMFGLDTGGAFIYNNTIPNIGQYVFLSTSTQFGGGLIFNGRGAYEDGILDASNSIIYKGTPARYMEFEYITGTGTGNCLSGKTYKVVVILTPNM
jgi:hypothetical protein